MNYGIVATSVEEYRNRYTPKTELELLGEQAIQDRKEREQAERQYMQSEVLRICAEQEYQRKVEYRRTIKRTTRVQRDADRRARQLERAALSNKRGK